MIKNIDDKYLRGLSKSFHRWCVCTLPHTSEIKQIFIEDYFERTNKIFSQLLGYLTYKWHNNRCKFQEKNFLEESGGLWAHKTK